MIRLKDEYSLRGLIKYFLGGRLHTPRHGSLYHLSTVLHPREYLQKTECASCVCS